MKKQLKKNTVFLFVNLMESDVNKVFMIRFERRILVDC